MMLRRALLVALLLPLLACSHETVQNGVRDPVGTGTEPTPLPPVVPTITVEYRVTGTIPNTNITYFSAQQGTAQVVTDLPWTVRYTTSELHPFLFLQAETPLDNFVTGSLTVQIFVNDVLFREARGTGFTLALSASGEVP
jgi:hypothetical protein